MNSENLQSKHMKYFTRLSVLLFLCALMVPAMAHINPKMHEEATPQQGTTVSPRNDCAQSTQQIEMSINNVRALLLNGGDVWWDLDDGRYIVPKVDPASGVPAVSSIFAGAVWIGGYDDVGIAAMASVTGILSRGYDAVVFVMAGFILVLPLVGLIFKAFHPT